LVLDASEELTQYHFSEQATIGSLLELLIFERGGTTAAVGLAIVHNNSQQSPETLLKELSPRKVRVINLTDSAQYPEAHSACPVPPVQEMGSCHISVDVSPAPEVPSTPDDVVVPPVVSPSSSPPPKSELPTSPPPRPASPVTPPPLDLSDHVNSGETPCKLWVPQFTQHIFAEGFGSETTVGMIRERVADRLRGVVMGELAPLLQEFRSIKTELQTPSWVQLLFGGRILRDSIVMQNLELGDQQVLAHVSWDALLPDIECASGADSSEWGNGYD
jgi:hypothetical protein